MVGDSKKSKAPSMLNDILSKALIEVSLLPDGKFFVKSHIVWCGKGHKVEM